MSDLFNFDEASILFFLQPDIIVTVTISDIITAAYLAAFVTLNDKINGNQWRGVFAQMLETTFAGPVESGATSADQYVSRSH